VIWNLSEPKFTRVTNFPADSGWADTADILCVVQTSAAGDGRMLSVVVKGRTTQPTVQLVRRQTAGDYDVSFTPSETGQHCIDVLFSDIPVTGKQTLPCGI